MIDRNILVGALIIAINIIPFITRKIKWLEVTAVITLLIVLLNILIK